MSIQTKDDRVFFRAKSTRKEVWRSVAEEEGRRLSEWLRWLADRRVAELARGEERAD